MNVYQSGITGLEATKANFITGKELHFSWKKKRIIYLHTLRDAFQQRELTAPFLGWFDVCSFEEAVFMLLSYFPLVKPVFGAILHLWFMVWNAHTQAAPSPP